MAIKARMDRELTARAYVSPFREKIDQRDMQLRITFHDLQRFRVAELWGKRKGFSLAK